LMRRGNTNWVGISVWKLYMDIPYDCLVKRWLVMFLPNMIVLNRKSTIRSYNLTTDGVKIEKIYLGHIP
jgi:hypothetical protein